MTDSLACTHALTWSTSVYEHRKNEFPNFSRSVMYACCTWTIKHCAVAEYRPGVCFRTTSPFSALRWQMVPLGTCCISSHMRTPAWDWTSLRVKYISSSSRLVLFVVVTAVLNERWISDVTRINTMAVAANNTGIIILGGGVAKHHICNANAFVSITFFIITLK